MPSARSRPGLLEQDQLNLLGDGNKLPVGALSNLEAPRSVSMKVVIVFVIAWCFLTIAVIVAASTRRFAAWDSYLLIAAVIVGLAVVVAIVMAP